MPEFREVCVAVIADPRPVGGASPDQVLAFERHIGHSLPPDYRGFVLTHNGGRPVPDAFTLRTDRGEDESIVMCFFPLRDLSLGQIDADGIDGLRSWPLHCAWGDLQNDLENLYEIELDPPLLPIGTDGFGNYISMVLAGEQTGAVVFLDHETAESWPLSSSFTAFLDSLRPRKRKGYPPMLGTGT
jgi:cell wall assembly regulator SMI1